MQDAVQDATNEWWPTLLQERAQYIDSIKHVAVATQIQLVVRGLDELAGLYGSVADMLRKGAAAQPNPDEAPSDLIQRLEQKALAFLRLAGTTRDSAQADQLRSLSAIFGSEAERLQAEAA